MRIKRDDLYAQVWSEPATKLAKRFEVSSSYLARVCEGLNVPHPPRGYWARKAAGEKIPIPPLPPAGPGDPVEWEKGIAVPERLPPLELAPAWTKSGKGDAPRPSRHPLVTAWRSFLDEALPNNSGYMVPRKKNMLDAFVTKAMIRSTADALNALFIELEMRGYRVQLAADHHHRPPVDIAQREITDRTDRYSATANLWQPGRPTVVYVRDAVIGLTVFELTENTRVRRTGSDRFVRIKDLPPVRRYAPQSPDETDLTQEMPTGRLVLRAYALFRDAEWRQEWTEAKTGDLVAMVTTIADFLEGAVPVIARQMNEAEQREREQATQADRQWRRYEAERRAQARQQARQASKEQLRAIVDGWNRAFAVEAFFTELSRRANKLEGRESKALEMQIQTARELMGGQDAIDRFLRWTPPAQVGAEDEPDAKDEPDDI